MSEFNPDDLIAADRLAALRAHLHAGRAVANADVYALLEAYDSLRQRLQTVGAGG